MLKNYCCLFVLIISLLSCSNEYYYKRGLDRAQHPTMAQVSNNLSPITSTNQKLVWETIDGQQYILAATWKADTTYYTKQYDVAKQMYNYNTGNYEIFVSLAPYLKDKQLGKLNDKRLTMRLNQLLGLPPQSDYHYFLEIWVKPEDLFRPCFDPVTSTNTCGFVVYDKDKKNQDHLFWMYSYIYNSYQDPNKMKQYPFTHLGYTYDWSHRNKSHVGLSEFVIGKNKNIYIKKVYTTRAYIGS
ncbi:MAG: hypothetical protein K0Q79_3553 [Flavipsychrobacter sp.]|nr:hypothetical protein [Flavipsychrobacter sp.]